MKKIVAAVFITLFVLGLCSCVKQSVEGEKNNDNPAGMSELIVETASPDDAEDTTIETVTESTSQAPETTAATTTAPTTTATTTVPQVIRKTYGSVNFTATDINGNRVSLSDYSDANVIMVNMWEPWCGPCVNEMPDLERLYENYKDKGLVIIGAFGDDESSARKIVGQKGITYPVIIKPDEFSEFETQYVPTTFFIDGNGNVLSEEPYIGSRSYSEWEQTVLSYMG